MTSRTPALIKDLAQLFVKYRLADWAPVIEELERGGRSSVARAVEHIVVLAQAKTPRRRTSPARKKRTSAPSAVPELRSDRAAVLTRINDELTARSLLPAIGELRSAILALGLKRQTAATRPEAIRAIVEHLNSVEDARFEAALATLVRKANENQQGDEYRRWFTIIESGRIDETAS